MVQFEKECGLRLIKELTSSDNTLSRIYGFILYTEQNPYVSMVLRNPFFGIHLTAYQGQDGQYLLFVLFIKANM